MREFEEENIKAERELKTINEQNDQLDESCHTLHKEFEQVNAKREELERKQLELTEENEILAVELEDFLDINEQIHQLIEKKAQRSLQIIERKKNIPRTVE